jgi:hypothetical protein
LRPAAASNEATLLLDHNPHEAAARQAFFTHSCL